MSETQIVGGSLHWCFLKFQMKISSFKHNCSTFLEHNRMYFCCKKSLKTSCFIWGKIALLGKFFFSRIIKTENLRCGSVYVHSTVQQCTVKCVAEIWANLTFNVDTGLFQLIYARNIKWNRNRFGCSTAHTFCWHKTEEW